MPDYVVDFRGLPACPCLAAWLPVYERELLARGEIKVSLDIYQLIGGAPQSGGTHTDGGAADTGQITDVAIWVARQMGADACWHRPYNWDGAGGMAHTHLVLTGCPHNGPARYQIGAVRRGENGLASHGPDTGPRPLSGRTWREGIAWADQQQEERDAMTPEDFDKIRAIVREEIAQAGDTILIANPLDDGKKPKWRLSAILGRTFKEASK